jgi:hypothetical protein
VGGCRVEGGDGDGVGSLGDDLEEVLRKETTMQGVGAVVDEVFGDQGVGTQDTDVRKVGMVWQGLDAEDEGRGEGRVAIAGVAQEKAVGLHGVGGKEETADGDGGEMVGLFKSGWSGLFALGPTMAGEEAGDVAFDKALVEIGEQVREVLVGATRMA